ncbi:hypothetical protein Peur_052941 [Populus x canadensis]
MVILFTAIMEVEVEVVVVVHLQADGSSFECSFLDKKTSKLAGWLAVFNSIRTLVLLFLDMITVVATAFE